MKPGKLYGVGIGPGDPRYLTLRAADVLRSVDVIFTVISQNASSSVSRSVVESLEPRGEIHLQIFSMSRDKAVRAAQVQANADAIITELKAGRDCAFATLGDAMTYSTFGYVLEIIREAIPGVELEIVPGITSFATLTAKAGTRTPPSSASVEAPEPHPVVRSGRHRSLLAYAAHAGIPHDAPEAGTKRHERPHKPDAPARSRQ